MSHLSNLTYECNNTRLYNGNEELFPFVNNEPDQNDSNKLLLYENFKSYKYPQGSQLLNNHNSNFSLFFEQNSNFIPFPQNEHSLGSEIDKNIKLYQIPITGSKDIMQNEKKQGTTPKCTVVNLTEEKIYNKDNVQFSIKNNHPIFLMKKRMKSNIESSPQNMAESLYDLTLKVNYLNDLMNINQKISDTFEENDSCKKAKLNTIAVKEIFNNNNNSLNNKSVDLKQEEKKKEKGKDKSNIIAKPKAKCKCNKSKCLQYYCECFQNGSFCKDCDCNNCFNTEKHKDERDNAINLLYIKKQKNKGKFKAILIEQGCKCFKSNCQKKYCECYNNGKTCSKGCKCVNCKNTEQNETILKLSKQLNERNFTNYNREKAYQLYKQSKPKTKFLIDKNIDKIFNKTIVYNKKGSSITSTSSTSLISCSHNP